MKNIKYLLLVIFCFILIGCTTTSNESKEVGSTSNFETVATNNSFTVDNNISSYDDIDYITEAMKATLDDIVIEMVVYTDNDNADKVQEGQIKSFRSIKATADTENKEKGENYYKFWMVSNGYYMVSSRIDNTLIFSKTLLKNKDKVEAILNEMKY